MTAHHHGSEHTHSPGSHGWNRRDALERLESPERRRFQDPDAFWDRFPLAPGSTVVEVGAGTGYFAIPAARRVGAKGRVYAVDVSADLVELLQERARAEGLPQLVPVLSHSDRIPLASEIADVVLLANVLHDVPPETVREAVRLVKRDGRILNADWKKEETPMGPPLDIRLTPGEAAHLLRTHGLELEETLEIGPYHYALRLRPRGPPR